MPLDAPQASLLFSLRAPAVVISPGAVEAMVVKTGVSLPDELYARLQRLANEMGYQSISRAIRDAVELFIAFNSWWGHRGKLRGVVVAVFTDHERAYNSIADIASKNSVKQIHVEKPQSPEKPIILYIFVEAHASELKDMYKTLTRLRGVAMVQPVFVPD